MNHEPASLLSSRAMLAHVKISQWQARRLDKKVTDETNRAHNAAHDAGRYTKALLAKEALAAIVSIAGEGRQTHYRLTLPWLDDGARILPAKAFDTYAEKMRDIRFRFEAAVSEFVSNYPTYVEDARRRLNGMFNEADYPDASEIGESFAFDTSIRPVPDKRDFRVQIGDAQAEQVRKHIEESSRAALHAAMQDAWRRISEVVGRMAERLNAYAPGEEGKRAEGTFKDSLVGNIRELVDILPLFNLSDDPALDQVCKRMEAELCRHEASELRENEGVRNSVAKAADAILADIGAYLA